MFQMRQVLCCYTCLSVGWWKWKFCESLSIFNLTTNLLSPPVLSSSILCLQKFVGCIFISLSRRTVSWVWKTNGNESHKWNRKQNEFEYSWAFKWESIQGKFKVKDREGDDFHRFDARRLMWQCGAHWKDFPDFPPSWVEGLLTLMLRSTSPSFHINTQKPSADIASPMFDIFHVIAILSTFLNASSTTKWDSQVPNETWNYFFLLLLRFETELEDERIYGKKYKPPHAAWELQKL